MKISSRIRTFFSSRFFKNISILSGGSALAQIIGVLIAPILSRLYTPEDFGVVGSLFAFTSVISLIGSLKYDQAIVRDQRQSSSRALVDLNVFLVFTVTLLSGIFLMTSPCWLEFLNDKENLSILFPLCFPIILFSALFNVYSARLNRDKEYKLMAFLQIIRRFTTSLSQVCLGFFSASALGLILGNVFGVLIPIVILFCMKRKPFRLYAFSSLNSLKNIALKYYRFPLYVMPQSFMNLLSAQLPVFILGYYFGIQVVGAYFFTLKIIQVPANFIGLSFRQVFYQEASQSKMDHAKVLRIFKKTTFFLSIVMSVPAAVLFVYGETLFVYVFGNQWSLAGLFASWMFLWSSSNIVTGPARALFLVYDKQKMVLIIDLFLLLTRGIVLYFFSSSFESIVVIQWFSVASVLFNLLVVGWWFRYFSKATPKLG